MNPDCTIDGDLTEMDRSSDDDSMSGMAMGVFHAGTSETILWTFWTVTDAGSMVLACFIIFVVAVLYEGMKYMRQYLLKPKAPRRRDPRGENGTCCNSKEALNSSEEQGWLQAMLTPQHFLQTGLHFVQFIVSYLLMLIFMTFNYWLCLAVALGASCGFFLFGWQRTKAVDITECCH